MVTNKLLGARESLCYLLNGEKPLECGLGSGHSESLAVQRTGGQITTVQPAKEPFRVRCGLVYFFFGGGGGGGFGGLGSGLGIAG